MAITRTFRSGQLAQGPRVDEFEKLLEVWFNRRVVTVNSGTSALTLALRLALVAGHKVVTTPMTCSATNLAVLAAGATPVWADIDPRTGLIAPASVDEVIRSNDDVKAIMAVDWGGQPCDYDNLLAIGERMKIPVIEDAAHAFGAGYKGRPIGDVADFTCFSFQAIKHLTCGDGGALTVPSFLNKKARNLRWFGIDRDAPTTEFRGEVDITEWGYKFHMNDIAATIGLTNLPYMADLLSNHRYRARYYDGLLDERFTRTAPTYDHLGSYWLYTVLLPSREERDAFKVYMNSNKVQASQVHWRNDTLSVFKPYKLEQLPGVEEFSSRMVCLPIHWDADQERVVEVANDFWRHV